MRNIISSIAQFLPLLMCSSAMAQTTAQHPQQHSSEPHTEVLATPEQLEFEATTLRVLATPEMAAAIRRIEQLYSHDPRARDAAGRARIKHAAQSIGVAAINYAISEDASRPAAIWGSNLRHHWHGMVVPGSGFGIENPDNIYQGITVAGGGRYVLQGRLPQPGPIELHFEVRDSIPGFGAMQVEGFRQLATLQSEQMQIEPDGRFRILIDSNPADQSANHLLIPDNGIYHIGIRQLLTDWAVQPPAELRVQRLDPAPAPASRNITELSRLAGQILDKIGPYWLNYNNQYIYTRPVNSLTTPRVRPGGRGISTSGHYALAADQALVVTLAPLGAASLGIQLADPWGVAYDYDQRSSSLNNAQAVANSDGTYTFVISARDPGVHNWLDSGGFASGLIAIRWQRLTGATAADAAGGIRSVNVIKLNAVQSAIPAGPGRAAATDRRAIRAARNKAYRMRLTQ
ncbi:MAG: hypothetical protein RIQ99_834 [Pseudomonadota bacterium]|jgi:hypothetical protein